MTVKTENSSDSPITMTLTRRGFVKIGGGLFVWLVTPLPAGGISTNERCLRRVQSTDIEVFAS